MRSNNIEQSTNIRNYAITAVCILIAFSIAFVFFSMWQMTTSSYYMAGVSVVCDENSADIFVNASVDLKNVSCQSLDRGVFQKEKIELGNLSVNNEEVCKFVSKQPISQSLRFEIQFNGQSVKRTCSTLSQTNFAVD